MLFSILVSVYNVEKYLDKCLKSVEEQTYQDFEVILVDDGSADQSGKMCDDFAKRYPDKVGVVHKQNEGLISARRVAIQAAKGEYCVFLDSDDFLDLDCLDILRKKIEKFSLPDLIIYRFAYYEDGEIIKCKYKDFGPDMIFKGEDKKILYRHMLEGSQLNSICTKAIKTEILKSDSTDYKRYYGKNMAEDTLQSLYPMTESKRILYINETLYYYRYNRESISRSYQLEKVYNKNMLHVYKHMLYYLPKWGMDTEENRIILQKRWVNDTKYLLEQYFFYANNFKEKCAVVCFDWRGFFPERLLYQDKFVYAIQKNKNTKVFCILYKKELNRKWKKIKRLIKEIVFRGKRYEV